MTIWFGNTSWGDAFDVEDRPTVFERVRERLDGWVLTEDKLQPNWDTDTLRSWQGSPLDWDVLLRARNLRLAGGQPPDWSQLLALPPLPTGHTLPASVAGVRLGIALERILMGLDFRAKGPVAFVPLQPGPADQWDERVFEIEEGGATHLALCSEWVIWSWCEQDTAVRAEAYRQYQRNDPLSPDTDWEFYLAAIVDMARQSIITGMPGHIGW